MTSSQLIPFQGEPHIIQENSSNTVESPITEGQWSTPQKPINGFNDQPGSHSANTFYLQGRHFHDRGEQNEALRYYHLAIEINPALAAAYNDLGTIYQGQEKYEEAIAWYQKALVVNSSFAEAYYNLGNVYKNQNKKDKALTCWQKAVISDPNLAEAHFNLGVLYYEQDQPEEALGHWQKAVQLKPDYVSAYVNSAVALKRQGQTEAAIHLFQKSLHLDPNQALSWVNLGDLYNDKGNVEEAIHCYRKALTIDPNMVEVYMNLGLLAMDQGHYEGAILCYQKSIELNPQLAEAHYNLANAFKDKGETATAVVHYREAILLRSDYNEAYNNLAITLHGQGQFEQANHFFRRALELKPDRPEVLNNLGNVLKDQRRMDEAVACYRKAILLDPDYPDGHWNLSLALLMNGCFEEGWPEYEWRWKLKGVADRPEFPQPLWDGEDLLGKRILLYAEQGLGDTIQFIRYVPLVVGRGGRVAVECQPELTSLLASMEGVEEIIKRGQPLPDFDRQLPLMSLPLVFQTRRSTIPARISYLSIDHGLVLKWRQRLAADRAKLKIGLAWAGRPTHSNDRHRSFSLKDFGPLAEIPAVRYYSLQKGEAGQQIQNTPEGIKLMDYAGDLVDFTETGALMENLDLIITVDTAVAHLAGALGRPVWVLLPYSSDWRWLLEREDSPWYPTMRLFRQPSYNDRAGLIRKVANLLKTLSA